MSTERDEVVRTLRAQARKVEEALLQIMGEPAERSEDPNWVTVPLSLPTSVAALMALLVEQGNHPVQVLYANVLLRGLWALSTEADLPSVARATALLIRQSSDEDAWESWSARHPQARAYVAQAQDEPQEGTEGAVPQRPQDGEDCGR
jgi:hypothetical protein